jgi:YidC/Oxa1 family membrane protein insertase
MISSLFYTIFYQPILNLLVGLYNILPGHDLGVAIVVLTLLIKVILLPFANKSLKSQKALQILQPKIKEIQTKYKDDKQRLTQELLELYKREKVSPFSSLTPLLIQLPILIALYRVLIKGLSEEKLSGLYSFIYNPEHLNTISFGILNLSEKNLTLAVLAGIAQFIQSKMLAQQKPPQEVANKPGAKDEAMLSIMNKQMLYFMPAFTVFIGATLPSGLTFYWFLSTVLTIIQQYIFFRKK